jgi:hypothetical protein
LQREDAIAAQQFTTELIDFRGYPLTRSVDSLLPFCRIALNFLLGFLLILVNDGLSPLVNIVPSIDEDKATKYSKSSDNNAQDHKRKCQLINSSQTVQSADSVVLCPAWAFRSVPVRQPPHRRLRR